MKNLALILFLFIGSLLVKGQAEGYEIIGDEVVFTFDARNYTEATSSKTGKRIHLEDIDISRAGISGEFNNWSEQGWRMTKTGKYTYQLKKPLKDFDDKISWEFKFIVNDEFWAEPDTEFSNIVRAVKDGMPLNAYNLRMYTAMVDPEGNAQCVLKGYTDAKKVILTGDFNRWNEDFFTMNKTPDGWELTLQLKAGTYQYKFIVDGNWISDPGNPDKVCNEYGNFNSVLSITKKITFSLKGYPNANKVILAGSFNGWDERAYRMKKTDTGWELTLELPGGKHQYKFIIDGDWITDPDNPLREYDGDGHINSVLMVE